MSRVETRHAQLESNGKWRRRRAVSLIVFSLVGAGITEGVTACGPGLSSTSVASVIDGKQDDGSGGGSSVEAQHSKKGVTTDFVKGQERVATVVGNGAEQVAKGARAAAAAAGSIPDKLSNLGSSGGSVDDKAGTGIINNYERMKGNN